MTVHTFRAKDSVSALEQVQRQLGEKAFILSIDVVEDQVKVLASDTLPSSGNAGPEATSDAMQEPNETDAAVRPRFLDPSQPRPFGATDLDADMPAPNPVFMRSMADQEGPMAIEKAKLTSRADVMTARRIVLFSVGMGGLEEAARRLAKHIPNTDILRWSQNPSDDAQAPEGVPGHQMTYPVVGPDLPPIAKGRRQVLLASDEKKPSEQLWTKTRLEPDTVSLLIMTAGLRRERIMSIASAFNHMVAGAILVGTDPALPSDAELADLKSAGLSPLWYAELGHQDDGLVPLGCPGSTAPKTARPRLPLTMAQGHVDVLAGEPTIPRFHPVQTPPRFTGAHDAP